MGNVLHGSDEQYAWTPPPDLEAEPSGPLELPPARAASLSTAALAELRRRAAEVDLRLVIKASLPTAPSLYTTIDRPLKLEVLASILADPNSPLNRAAGALLGMACADALGAPLEFMPVCDSVGNNATSSRFDAVTMRYVCALNKFRMKPGQWTDDTSMGLCIADSLIATNAYDGSDLRVRFWTWWNRGYCNAFAKDASRSSSVGLGGNIGKSLRALEVKYYGCDATGVPPTFESGGEDAGNGSLMRLAPIPIFFSRDVDEAMRCAKLSSLATHPGPIAAEACAFLAFAIATAIHDPRLPLRAASTLTAATWLDEIADAYLDRLLDRVLAAAAAAPAPALSSTMPSTMPSSAAPLDAAAPTGAAADPFGPAAASAAASDCRGGGAAASGRTARFAAALASEASKPVRPLLLLLRSHLPANSTERNWNWRGANDGTLDIERTLAWRGRQYNGYPVSPGYFGAFSMDGLAMALFAVRETRTFTDAVVRCVNFLGDADSTASIAGQLAGALYGASAIDTRWMANLVQWDDGEVALRAALLHAARAPVV
jgi:ADP-ribosylglycohydrolase